jgi:hypothetical protein
MQKLFLAVKIKSYLMSDPGGGWQRVGWGIFFRMRVKTLYARQKDL